MGIVANLAHASGEIGMYLRLMAGLLLALVSMTATGAIGTIDNVPAATLFFPHFEVDADDPQGVNTILTVHNTSATAIMVNVTLWTDLGLPTDQFNIYLTGYDLQTIDLRSIFRRILPITGSDGQDPTDTISPQGNFSQDINFASCNGNLSTPQNRGTQFGSNLSRDIVGAHSGQASDDYFGGLCGSRDLGDGIARGYVTMDTTSQCTLDTPTTTAYFTSFVATYQNVMRGDYTIIDPSTGTVLANDAVGIEADPLHPVTSSGVDKQTFYGRFVGFTGVDHREPLPTAWAGRASAGRTDVDFWRDPGTVTAPFACGGAPVGLPTGQRLVNVFDVDGSVDATPAGNLFPFAAGSTTGATLGIAPDLGWLFVNMNLAAPSGPLGAIRQSWLTLRQTPRGVAAGGGMQYSVPAIQLGNAGAGDSPIVP